MRLESTLEMWYSYTGEKDKAHAERSVWAFLVKKPPLKHRGGKNIISVVH